MSTSSIKNVIVLGATGSIGPVIVQALLAADFTVSVVTRKASKARFPDTIKVIESDYSPASLVAAFKCQEAVVSTIATFSTSEQIKIIDAAIEAGVHRFIPSEYGIDLSTPEAIVALPPGKSKLDTVNYLRSKESTGLSWTGVVVGGFFDWSFQIPGMFGWDIPQRKVTIFDGGDHPFEVTNVEQIGRTVAAVLSYSHLVETANQYVYVNSFTITQNEVLAMIEKTTRTKFDVSHAKRKDVADAASKKMATGVFEEIAGGRYLVGSVDAITAEVYNYSGFNNFSTRGLWNDRLGLPNEDLEETIRKIV